MLEEKPALVRRIDDLLLSSSHILLYGPPGTGKTMLARRIHLRQRMLMPIPEKLALEIGRIWWSAGLVTNSKWQPVRPFRAPHHTASRAGLTGTWCRKCGRFRPGEMSLAHGGVLFLDDIEEFQKEGLEALLEPLLLKDQLQALVRIGEGTQPADFTLVATTGDESAFARRVPEKLRKRLCVLEVIKEEVALACKWVDDHEPSKEEE